MGLEQIKVKLIGSYGSDLLIAQQAWQSTAAHEEKEPTEADIRKILEILITRRHTKPLEVVSFHFEVKWPISCDRQQQTHRMQTASVARSGRYGSAPMEYYDVPNDVKDILTEKEIVDCRNYYISQIMFYEKMVEKYSDKLPRNRAREVFRDLLPQGMMTERLFKMDLHNFVNYLKQRRTKHAQKEIAYAANLMLNEARKVCPIAFDILEKNGMVGY